MRLYVKVNDKWCFVPYATSVPVATVLGSAFRARGYETKEED